MFTKVHLVSTLPSSVRSVVVSMIVPMVVLIVPFTLQIKIIKLKKVRETM